MVQNLKSHCVQKRIEESKVYGVDNGRLAGGKLRIASASFLCCQSWEPEKVGLGLEQGREGT